MSSFFNKIKDPCFIHKGKTRAAALVLALLLTAAAVSGCGRPVLSLPFGSVHDVKEEGHSDAGTVSAGSQGGNGSPEQGDRESAGETDVQASDAREGVSSAPEPVLTLPYEESDPAQMASAYPWICSDLVDNVQKLGGLTETQDFHAAVNRDWLTSSEIPSGYISYDSFAERQLEVDSELTQILESNVLFSDPYISHCQQLIRDYYTMWLDWDARNAAGIEPLRDVVTPLLQVHTLDEMTFYLSDPDTTIRALPLCSAYTAANPNDADRYAVYISPPSLVFQDPMYYDYLEADSWKTQPRYMYAAGYMLERLGYLDEERDQILKDSYAFECEMAAHMMTTEEAKAEDSSIRCNNPRTYEELMVEQGAFPLIGMLEAAGLDQSETFILEEPDWLACMNSLYNEEHLEKMKAYLLVSDVLQFMELLDRGCYDQMIRVRNYLSGSSGQVDEKKAACDAVNDVLSEELGDVYAETFVTDKTRREVQELISDVITEYRTMLQGEDFLSDATKAEAVRKLDSLTVRVASKEDHSEEDKVLAAENEAGKSSVNRPETERILEFKGPDEGGTLVDARIAISEDACLSIAEKVNQPVDRTEWLASPQDVNAYYYPLDNSINIPSGILGGVFYSDQMSYEEKLGHLGVIVAHEISHAFDTSGRQYDDHGNLRNWWSEEDYRRFHARAQKLVDYYNGFEPIEGCKVKGAMLDTEAIADLTGVKCMLQIASKQDGFDYDRFFRALALNWRCLTSLETEAYAIEQDSHPLAYLRTNAVVVQFEEFHRTYGTKEGDGMYLAPQYRLEVW